MQNGQGQRGWPAGLATWRCGIGPVQGGGRGPRAAALVHRSMVHRAGAWWRRAAWPWRRAMATAWISRRRRGGVRGAKLKARARSVGARRARWAGQPRQGKAGARGLRSWAARRRPPYSGELVHAAERGREEEKGTGVILTLLRSLGRCSCQRRRRRRRSTTTAPRLHDYGGGAACFGGVLAARNCG